MDKTLAKLELGGHLRSQARAWEREDIVRQSERGIRIGVRKQELGKEMKKLDLRTRGMGSVVAGGGGEGACGF